MSPYCDDQKKYAVVDAIVQSYVKDRNEGKQVAGQQIKDLIDVNGIRVVFEDSSWGLVRASSNKPSLVIVAESFGTKEQLYDIVDDINSRLSKYPEVGEFDQTMPPYDGED
jgi:phosphomannomutase/phosphoglucomutase